MKGFISHCTRCNLVIVHPTVKGKARWQATHVCAPLPVLPGTIKGNYAPKHLKETA